MAMAPARRSTSFLWALPVLLMSWYCYGMLKQLFGVGCGYTSRTICSGVFISNRTASCVVENDMQLLARTLFRYHVDFDQQTVHSSTLFGFPSCATRYHNQYTGCAGIVNTSSYESSYKPVFDAFSKELGKQLPQSPAVALPTRTNQAIQKAVDAEFTTSAYDHSHTRALVVVHEGHIVAEGYATRHMGITRNTGHIGFSMAKGVLAILLGMRIRQGVLRLHGIVYRNYTLAQLLNMADILPVSETYSELSDIPNMLYNQESVLSFAESASSRAPRGADHFYYNSALSNILSHVLRQTFPTIEEYWRFPRQQLFDVIGAESIVMDTDQTGLFMTSSFAYATAVDWSRLGLLLVQRGVWNGVRLVDEDYVDFMTQRTEASADVYGGQIWCVPTKPVADGTPVDVQRSRMSTEHLLLASPPLDTCFMSGFNGQYVYMSPSLDLVVTRLGQTKGMVPDSDQDVHAPWQPTWNVTHFLGAVFDAVRHSST